MNGTSQNVKCSNFEKTYPGCLGRMVNLFELNIGVSPNRLLTDKPHRDAGSPVSRSRSDVSRLSPSPDPLLNDVIVPEVRNISSYKKLNGTPIKMLIDHEMSKEVDLRRSPPNLVAKLMGLDSLPQPDPDLNTKRTSSKGQPRSQAEIPMSNWEQQQRFSLYGEPKECNDVYQSATNDKKMALIRRKFLEAKRLSMGGQARQSKQFQDALDVLSSNRDLFLKCLKEPSWVFAQQLCCPHSLPPPRETTRITVLRPSKNADNLNFSGCRERKSESEKGAFARLSNSPPIQRTRIVVLKPNLEKVLYSNKAITSPQSHLHGEDFLGNMEDNDINRELRQVAKAITDQMCEKFDKNETTIYSANESSSGKPDIEYPAGDLSESEATSPMSRHSWDYLNNRHASPFSSSSFSRASYSPESSVCREAKKRLSDRWAMVVSNGFCQEQRQMRRSSSTLGEMLALSETKHKHNEIAVPLKQSVADGMLEDSNNLLENGRVKVEDVDINSPRNLNKSKSVPVSCQFGTRLDVETPAVSNKGKLEVEPQEDAKARSQKLWFKGKVSSLFFSKSKKGSKDKVSGPETKDGSGSTFLENVSSDGSESPVEKVPKHSSSQLVDLSSKAPSTVAILPKSQFLASKSAASGNLGENQDQPSPISVLDPPFELNEHTSKVYPRYIEPDPHGYGPSLGPRTSNFIDKAPPIGSIARTLSWDDSCLDTASSHPTNEPSNTTQATTTNEGQECHSFVRTLLSSLGLEGEVNLGLFCARWHSRESPLDPSLRDTCVESKNGRTRMNEARQRRRRSMEKLVFDCVNTVLIELAGSRLGMDLSAGHMQDEVWGRMGSWFSGGCMPEDVGDESVIVVETVVRNEVAGKGWVENLRLERDILGREMEGCLVEELLEEAVAEYER